MAREKRVSRTVETHKVKTGYVQVVDGDVKVVELPVFEMFNEGVTNEKVIRRLKKEHGKDKNYVILGVETSEQVYAMEMEEFLRQAMIVEK